MTENQNIRDIDLIPIDARKTFSLANVSFRTNLSSVIQKPKTGLDLRLTHQNWY